MKNFPHQHTLLSNLRATLEAIRVLSESGEDPSDDGVLGDRLARDRIHRFRGLDYTNNRNLARRIEKQISQQRGKPSSKQGARTAARENRKTLQYLGWLESNGTDLTIAGEALLRSDIGSDEEMDIMRVGVSQIELPGSKNNSSHPILILLNLVDRFAFKTRDGMELALEADDDTEKEFQRVSYLAQRAPATRQRRLTAKGVSENSIANARKVLPVFAMDSGLMEYQSGKYVLTREGRELLKRPKLLMGGRAAGSRRRRHASTKPTTKTRDPNRIGSPRAVTVAALRARSLEEQRAAAELLYERTNRHQELVRATAIHCKRHCSDCVFLEDASSYDLIIDSGIQNPLDLVEAKTIDDDAHSQVKRAVGQLYYYQYFVVRRKYRDRNIIKSVVVDDHIGDDLAEFLESRHIGLLVVTGHDVRSQNASGQDIVDRLFS